MKAHLVIQGREMLVSRNSRHGNSLVEVGPYTLGSEQVIIIAGPCAVESEEMLRETAFKVRASGAVLLRGGAFKPRTSPYSFQGLGIKGLKILAKVGSEMNMPVVSELMDSDDLDIMVEHVDVIQIGARNMQNFSLLRKLGRVNRPVILKRGLAATIEEWLMAAEYILDAGNSQVILCERGIRSSEPWTRNTLDLSAVALAKSLSHLPVIVDPSHATGVRGLVAPMAKASLAAGADGLMVEVHPCPEKALSDGEQSLTPAEFSQMMKQIDVLVRAVGRRMR